MLLIAKIRFPFWEWSKSTARYFLNCVSGSDGNLGTVCTSADLSTTLRCPFYNLLSAFTTHAVQRSDHRTNHVSELSAHSPMVRELLGTALTTLLNSLGRLAERRQSTHAGCWYKPDFGQLQGCVSNVPGIWTLVGVRHRSLDKFYVGHFTAAQCLPSCR